MSPGDGDLQPEGRAPISRPAVVLMGLVTIAGFGGLGWLLIDVVQQRSLAALISGPAPVHVQLAWGAALGVALGAFGMWVGRRRFVALEMEKFAFIGRSINRLWLIVFISLCAGVGEEIFFRGALQHWLGIPLTAVLFVAIHGYLNPWNWRLSVLGLVVTAGVLGMGWLAEQLGLVSAIAAHAVLDMIVLADFSRRWPPEEPEENEAPLA